MRILQLYNRYQSGGRGESRVVELIEDVLSARGHTVRTVIRDSQDIDNAVDKVKAFVTGAYSRAARQAVHSELLSWTPDIVHIHNLYPLFSPSVLLACRDLRIPVVMTVHNYGLTCPTATHFRSDGACLRCIGGREYHCILGNCKDDFFKSTGYAFRSFVARTTDQFTGGVQLFLAISEFVKAQLVQAGFPASRIEVLENAVPMPATPAEPGGEYVAFLGGMQKEKGVPCLLEAAARLPQCKFVFAGDGPERRRWAHSAPKNCEFVGAQERRAVEDIYRRARFVVVPSVWWEPFGLVAIEAMSFAKPVIAARSGALTEVVQENLTGVTFAPNDCDGLTEAIAQLWNDPARVAELGGNAYHAASEKFNLSRFGDRLTGFYEAVVAPDRSTVALTS
jgi:glycosyltransferase involved in cell wall biosynthesis